RLEEALLAESLRREGIAKRAKEQGKENPLDKELSPEKKIAQRYERYLQTITKTDEEDVANYFLSAVARAHDPHSEYFSARELQEFKVSIKNELVGIGALLRSEDDGATKIDGIVNNGPADRQGELQLKDRVVAVDSMNDGNWVDIMFLPIDKVVEMIRGKEGAEVALKVEPADGAPGETRVIVIRREVVTMKDELATAEIYSYGDGADANKLGVVKLPSFYFDPDDRNIRVSVDLERLLERLKKEKIDGLVIDLRGNGGGSLEEVRRITSFFVGAGPAVQIKATSGFIKSLGSDSPRKPIYDGPLVVLTDKGSASASEILAGALQDYNRAVIVGESSTFGKGTVQQPLEISRFMPLFADQERAGAVKLTIQKFYRVAGSSTQMEGVVPDIVLPSIRDALEVGEKYAKHALPHDTIKQAGDFRPFNRQNLFLSVLEERSEARVKSSKDFEYVIEDRERVIERVKKNTVSLNIEKRRAEIAENEVRRKARNAERLKRFEIQEKKDEKEFSIYRMTLDDIAKEKLPKVDRESDNERHMRRAKDAIADLDDTPEWPSGLDATKREGLEILGDLVDAVKASKIAGVLRKD
ncbi:carboxy terminal-processing peptidase, partial [Akkermansiaceae bacterium]|nr:carboxy terminal-processing peptidase [Akkermansiaceae bacterium]